MQNIHRGKLLVGIVVACLVIVGVVFGINEVVSGINAYIVNAPTMDSDQSRNLLLFLILLTLATKD